MATLQARFPEAVVGAGAASGHPHVVVAAEHWPVLARFLRADPEMGFNLLRCISGLDLPADNQLAAVYDLHALAPGPAGACWRLVHEFAVRVVVSRDRPHIPSVADVWPAADWHEREAYDLLGIVFDNHPDSVTDHDGTHPRRILCPDDWVGFPLRKDYVFPLEYHGIPGTTEFELTSPVH